jgi:hypothetical protein
MEKEEILQDAIRILNGAKPAALGDNRATIEAGSWLFDEQDQRPFSLNWISDHLGIEEGRLHMQLQKSRPTIPLHRRGSVARGNRISPPQREAKVRRTFAGIETVVTSQSYKRSQQWRGPYSPQAIAP